MNKAVLPLIVAVGMAFGQDPAGVQRLKTQAAHGNLEAQLELAQAYGDGEGVSQEWQEAANWWRKAAEQGDANARDALRETAQ